VGCCLVLLLCGWLGLCGVWWLGGWFGWCWGWVRGWGLCWCVGWWGCLLGFWWFLRCWLLGGWCCGWWGLCGWLVLGWGGVGFCFWCCWWWFLCSVISSVFWWVCVCGVGDVGFCLGGGGWAGCWCVGVRLGCGW
ncbi:hypothetical protein, partial [Pseudomonas syringae group genomosp. 7]|uniref:hypothetical protein n=1 Tax=Pseudomonas syringae group genomosp. 7 TaxID=251699 RepID=UPI00376F92F0